MVRPVRQRNNRATLRGIFHDVCRIVRATNRLFFSNRHSKVMIMTVTIAGTRQNETGATGRCPNRVNGTRRRSHPPRANPGQLLKAKMRAEDLGKRVDGLSTVPFQAAAIIAQFTSVFTASWLAANAPTIAVLQTNLTANGPNGATLLRSAQEHAVNTAMAQGKLSAYTDILSVMT